MIAATSPSRAVLIALGGNLSTDSGPPEATLQAAIGEIGLEIGPVLAASRLFNTPCFPAGAGPDYVNAAIRIATDALPEDILGRLHAIEARHGRARIQRWGMRTLDLDLLAVGDLVLPDAATQANGAPFLLTCNVCGRPMTSFCLIHDCRIAPLSLSRWPMLRRIGSIRFWDCRWLRCATVCLRMIWPGLCRCRPEMRLSIL